jgi:hypothetical protein
MKIRSKVFHSLVFQPDRIHDSNLTEFYSVMCYCWFRNKMALDGPNNYPGVTSPISLAEPKPHDLQLTEKLQEAMMPHEVFESEAELAHRFVL